MSNKRPAVIVGFYAYCSAVVLLGVILIIAGIAMIVVATSVPEPGFDEAMGFFCGVATIVGCLPVGLAYAAPLFLPERKWLWTFDLILIVGGLTSCLFLPFSIILLLKWFEPGIQDYFSQSSFPSVLPIAIVEDLPEVLPCDEQ